MLNSYRFLAPAYSFISSLFSIIDSEVSSLFKSCDPMNLPCFFNHKLFNLIKYNYTILMHMSIKIFKLIKIDIFYLYIRQKMVLLDGATDAKYQLLENQQIRSEPIPGCWDRNANHSLSVTPVESYGLARDTTQFRRFASQTVGLSGTTSWP